MYGDRTSVTRLKAAPGTLGSQAGIAMITVLFVTVAVMLLAVTFSIVAMAERRSTSASIETEQALQLADAGTERARRLIVESFNNTFLSIGNFLTSVRSDNIEALAGVHTIMIDGTPVHWEVRGVSDPSAPFGWIDVAASAGVDGQAVQTVVRRVGFGASSTFNLAMHSETTDCMFCHLRVNGDVGNLVFMRPGWGREGRDGQGSGGNGSGLGMSIVNGNVFAAQNVTNDETSGNRLNGAQVTGVIERFSTNASLPVDLDGDGIADFPPIYREIAIENALGSVSAGSGSCVVPLGGTYNPGSCASVSQTGTINGNLVLHGTESNPINLNGDIWVEGDVIISGYVQGLGGLYAGRNVYIAGDVRSVTPAYRINAAGQCVTESGSIIMSVSDIEATGFSPADACARRSIADDTDALRIAARGSIIVGDYTEYDADGNLKPVAGQQSAEFYRQQFGFDRNENRQYDASNGDELRCNGTGGPCVNAEGVTVTNRVSADGYSGSFRPGRVTSSGFSSWMSDAQYQEILGTEEFTYNSWRWEFPNSTWTNGNQLADALFSLIDSGFPYPQALEIIDRRVNFNNMSTAQFNTFRNRVRDAGYAIGNTSSAVENVQGSGAFVTTDETGEEARYHWDGGNSLRVVHTARREYETQVNRIDAFLYANQRIAGKTSMQAMSITGGLVARDLGILAPGRALENWTFGSGFANRINSDRAEACSTPTSEYYVYGSEDCALTVNYDHRLRNGGYGYNIIEGRIGITLDWQVADSREDRVNAP